MTGSLYQFAEAAQSNMFASLGIDWRMLLLQGAAFLIFVYVMAKWVMPPLVGAVDARQKAIEEAVKSAESAEKSAKHAEAEIEKKLASARRDAADIVATARDEATAAIEKAKDKAKGDAERITTTARDQITKDIVAARQTLRNDTLELVALATEKVVGKHAAKVVTDKEIAQAIEENK